MKKTTINISDINEEERNRIIENQSVYELIHKYFLKDGELSILPVPCDLGENADVDSRYYDLPEIVQMAIIRGLIYVMAIYTDDGIQKAMLSTLGKKREIFKFIGDFESEIIGIDRENNLDKLLE